MNDSAGGALQIFDAREHEPLAFESWDVDVAREFVARTVSETDDAFDPSRGWSLHPEDRSGDETQPYNGVYCGSAGTMWALTHLARTQTISLDHDYADAIARCEERYRSHPRETGAVVPSYFLGTVGIMTARYAITGDASVLGRLDDDLRANVGNPTREALWGSPGTTLAALLIRERSGTQRYDDVLRATQDELWATWEPSDNGGGLLWEQDLYGRCSRYVGAGHGAIGNLAPFIRAADLLSAAQRATLRERVARLLAAYAVRDGAAANWVTLGLPREGNRMQWCHGSPGVIIGLANYPAGDDAVEQLLVQGGEGIWRAGPLRKGPTLCHGTAGNGFALLRLASRTHDERWERRAQLFAMHAMHQVAQWRDAFGMPAFSLWTGELGVALYVAAVLRRDPAILSLDVL